VTPICRSSGCEPRDDFQRALYAQALQITMELGHKRALLLEETGGSIPMFLVVLVFWLALIFTSFGLFAPTNSTVIIGSLHVSEHSTNGGRGQECLPESLFRS
jgi:hypothetical protein